MVTDIGGFSFTGRRMITSPSLLVLLKGHNPFNPRLIESKLLNRAKNNGYKVLVVTLDTWALAWRPADLDHTYLPFASGIGNQTGFSDPAFRAKFKENSGKEVEDDVFGASRAWAADVFSGAAHTWEQLELLKKHWDGPIVLKGIQHVEDAKKALEVGMQGIVVSNHGGRQLDGAIGSLEVLPEIVDAVGDKMTVLFDSGIRTGVDVMKALCLGAKGVLIGRPWVYGLGIGGKNGAKSVLQGILAVSISLSLLPLISSSHRYFLANRWHRIWIPAWVLLGSERSKTAIAL